MIDEETERAVAGWVRLGDDLAGRRGTEERTRCARCGSTQRLLGRGPAALCAHCYLERGGSEDALIERRGDRAL